METKIRKVRAIDLKSIQILEDSVAPTLMSVQSAEQPKPTEPTCTDPSSCDTIPG